ncbi:MAG TPA: class I SAM-dependent methyltransferase [Steroidobacteraceae bacterium]|nr:class I SAM-dependent methyltransferase [Steroidobacteraceae bacterium]
MTAPAPDRNTGWLHLLSREPQGARVLCVDTPARDSAAPLAYFMDAHVTRHVVEPDDPAIPGPAGGFDMVLCRMLGADWFPGTAQALLDECARVLAPDGLLYLDAGDTGWSSRPQLLRRMLGLLRQRGFTYQRTWAAMCDRGSISEILPAAGYRSARNSWRRAESAKEVLFGPGARWLAPAQVVVASRCMLQAPALQELDPGATDGKFERFIINPAKSFYQPRGTGARMHVLPGDLLTVERRRTEFGILDRLSRAGLDIARLVPGFREEILFRGRPAFSMQAFDGVTVDLPVPHMSRLFDAAFEVLVRFNEQSLRMAPLGNGLLEDAVDRAARAAVARYPAASATLSGLRQTLLDSVSDGQPRAIVWSHGDFKLENLVFDRRTRAVQAVIDWELACEAGLPMVDLLYLIGYREITLGSSDDILEVLSRGMPHAWSPMAAQYVRNYMARFHMTARHAWESLAAMFLHHIGLRYAYGADDRGAMERINRVARDLRGAMSP